jgi:hypothetical protein
MASPNGKKKSKLVLQNLRQMFHAVAHISVGTTFGVRQLPSPSLVSTDNMHGRRPKMELILFILPGTEKVFCVSIPVQNQSKLTPALRVIPIMSPQNGGPRRGTQKIVGCTAAIVTGCPIYEGTAQLSAARDTPHGNNAPAHGSANENVNGIRS